MGSGTYTHGEYLHPEIEDRLEKLEKSVQDLDASILDKRISGIEGKLEDFAQFKQSTEQMLYWWRGNGSPGARELMTKFVTEEYVEKIIDYTIERMWARMKEQDEERRSSRSFRFIDIFIAAGVLALTAVEIISRLL